MHAAAGLALLTLPSLALSLSCSESRAQQLMTEADVFSALAGGLQAVEDGLLTVEGCRAVAELLGPVEAEPRAEVWRRLLVRLRADREQGAPRPVARLRESVRRSLERVDAGGVAARRAAVVRATTGVTVRGRDDGLFDLFALGLSGPDALAVKERLDRAAEQPWGGWADLTVGQRRVRVLVDTLLGRCRTTPEGDLATRSCPGEPDVGGHASAAACRCLPGTGAPCGAEVMVLLPIGAALSTTEEVAELAGHGPLPRADLDAVLRNRPTLRAAWVDELGVPVAAASDVLRPGTEPSALRAALLALQAMTPPVARRPRHPDDHAPPDAARTVPGAPAPPEPPDASDAPDPPCPPGSAPDGAARPSGEPQVLGHPHPAGTPGPYRPSAALRRFLRVRSPRCEWAGCGARARRCDDEHDVAHPEGPTCSCNLGPLCRRHHRCKQAGMHKQRERTAGVAWTSPSGRTWRSPVQHEPLERPPRPPAPLSPPTWRDQVADALHLAPDDDLLVDGLGGVEGVDGLGGEELDDQTLALLGHLC